MATCKISIVVPVYNGSAYLRECIESILRQGRKDFEAIFIDDHSTDNSAGIIQNYSDQDHRVKLVKNSANLGITRSRNIGIEIASGEYIMFVDADDFLEDDLLERIFDAIRNDTACIVFNHKEIDPKNKNTAKEIDVLDKNSFGRSRIDLKKTDVLYLAIESCHSHGINLLFGSCWGRVYNLALIKKHRIQFDERVLH